MYFLEQEKHGRHFSMGSRWSVSSTQSVPETPSVLVTLDASDPVLNEMLPFITEQLPICSFINSDLWEGPQSYTFDGKSGKIVFDRWADSDGFMQDSSDQLKLDGAQIRLALSPWAAHTASDDDEVIDNLLGGSACTLVARQAIWIDTPMFPECTCGVDPEFVMQIGYEMDEGQDGIFSPESFFIGEAMLYFHLCASCRRVFVNWQSA